MAKVVRLYRAVGEDEFKQMTRTSTLDPLEGMVEGKYFAETAVDAVEWGKYLYDDEPYRVVEVELSREVADQFYRWPLLDAIGPARFAEPEQLRGVDVVVREVKM